ncbi:hypothetical protein [Streptomyces chryseus]|uniref:hypothetical protein n=1 Tax=Streptomyces chryseus TaxID=68186 RepID=UPI00110FE295|nr:hypothetical protein [Streptomyces chryseus]
MPDILVTISASQPSSDHGPDRWRKEGDEPLTGIVVDAGLLTDGSEAVLTHVLHECAHVLNWLRNTKDTTMRGLYHNQRYLAAAEEVGLVMPEGAERTSKGYADPILSDGARERFAEDLKALDSAIAQTLPYVTLPTPTNRSSRTPDRLTVECKCTPPRKLRISQTVFAQGPIRCEVCKSLFTA